MIDIDSPQSFYRADIVSFLAEGGARKKYWENEMKVTELVVAIDLLRKAGWRVEPPAKSSSTASRLGKPGRRGRPPKNGRRKRGRPRKQEI
jgi:hypothetical protein